MNFPTLKFSSNGPSLIKATSDSQLNSNKEQNLFIKTAKTLASAFITALSSVMAVDVSVKLGNKNYRSEAFPTYFALPLLPLLCIAPIVSKKLIGKKLEIEVGPTAFGRSLRKTPLPDSPKIPLLVGKQSAVA